MAPEANLRPGIDRGWLDEELAKSPARHAYAIWDLEHYPDQAQFFTLTVSGGPKGYLLIWRGTGGTPSAHWISDEPDDQALLAGFPSPPFLAFVPERRADTVVASVHNATTRRVDLMENPGPSRPTTAQTPVRPLTMDDQQEFHALVDGDPEHSLSRHRDLDLDTTRSWGAFDGRKMVSFAHASVTLPQIWILNGIYTDPAYRGKGYGRAATEAATRAGLDEVARVGLYVFSDNTPAVRLYRHLGFREVERLVLVDATSSTSSPISSEDGRRNTAIP